MRTHEVRVIESKCVHAYLAVYRSKESQRAEGTRALKKAMNEM